MSSSLDRVKLAYSAFWSGLRRGGPKPPAWEDLEPWMRDALMVAYYQGELDSLMKMKRQAEDLRKDLGL